MTRRRPLGPSTQNQELNPQRAHSRTLKMEVAEPMVEDENQLVLQETKKTPKNLRRKLKILQKSRWISIFY